jgi:hypothetical protein
MTNLNIGGSSNFIPKVKFNSKSGNWSVRGENGTDEIEMPTFIADCLEIRTGWQRYREYQAPERVIDPTLDRMAPCPGEGFKRCFVILVYSEIYFKGLAELSSTSIHMGNAIRKVFRAYEIDRDNHPGKLPVITCTGSEEMQDKYGTNYKPILELEKWVSRPSKMLDQSPVDETDVWSEEVFATQHSKGDPSPQSDHISPSETGLIGDDEEVVF